ncbi:RNA binding methyltransferase FtsJ like [invertebrate metagenome]|uniref:RNA binding methyltransferase FtsJ like n=1 Tax=invertebrate metagenome TaxID=1711999 RepID=A0A484HA46_9ZZZZ
MNKGKIRLDQLLVERNLAANRGRAQALVMAGCVSQSGQRLEKPGQLIAATAEITLHWHDHPWVSRGGLKLAHGLAYFGVLSHDKVALDIGSSTGGFTDVLLAGGATRVYAVDVGYGQLAMRLRQDQRVVILERTNARFLSTAQVPEPVDLVVCDTSFIGLQTVLPAPLSLTRPGAQLIALIKPQFEVGRNRVGKGGVVRDTLLQNEVCHRISYWLSQYCRWHVLGVVTSPIVGAKGNQEFLLYAVRQKDPQVV